MLEREFNSSIYELKFCKMPLWRIFRSYTRYYYLNSKENFIKNTFSSNKKSILIKNFVISLFQIIGLLIKRPHKNLVFLAFPRMYKIGDSLIDKISDPVFFSIKNSVSGSISFNFLYDNYSNVDYKKNDNHYSLDAPFILAHCFAFVITPIIFVVYGLKVFKLYKIARRIFELPIIFFFKYIYWLSEFICNKFAAEIIFRCLKSKNLVVVNRDNYLPYLLTAKQCNMRIIELQHGVTHGANPLYSGPYDGTIDPDYFCTFGKAWFGHQFAIPLDRIRNIGWAYNEYVKEILGQHKNALQNHILIISSPEISDKIISATIELAIRFPDYRFAIRLHPHEELLAEQITQINKCGNIYIQDKSIESTLAISQFEYVIGENSSVVYEALSMGKNVARFNYGGLLPSRVEKIENDGFFYLFSPDDFAYYIAGTKNSVSLNDYYSPYDASLLSSLII